MKADKDENRLALEYFALCYDMWAQVEKISDFEMRIIARADKHDEIRQEVSERMPRSWLARGRVDYVASDAPPQ